MIKKKYPEDMNIWKSYMWTAGWVIIWKRIIAVIIAVTDAVIDATFESHTRPEIFQAFFSQLQKLRHSITAMNYFYIKKYPVNKPAN